jgi:branched-chain amino acid transport system substrate-binding protein
MDEQQMFELFHEALDVQPRPGAFDRLKAVLGSSSVKTRRPPPIRLPLPRINLVLAAAVLAVVIVVAAVGGFLVLNHALGKPIPAGSRGTIVIGNDDARSGADGQDVLPIQLGEAFAIARVGSVKGYALKYATSDDAVNGAHDPQKGLQNLQTMLADPKLLAMIGPSDSAVARAEIPSANAANLAIVSPVNTDQCLTVGAGCTLPRAYELPTGVNNYFRIAANDSLSGPAMADFAYDRLGLRTIAVWDDQETFGVLAADGFSAEFTRVGGKVVARRGFNFTPSGSACENGCAIATPDFRPWLRQAKAAGAEAIYAGAVADLDGCVARAQSQGIFDSSSDYLGFGNVEEPEFGIATAGCIRDAGQMATDHMYATLGVGAAELNPDAQPIIAAYKAKYPDPASVSSGTFAGYDSAMILIDAIGRAIDANGGRLPTRHQVLLQVAQTANFHGLTGTFTFNAAGDPTAPTLQVVQNRGGAWVPVTNLVVSNPLAA